MEGLQGCFVNTLAIRISSAEDPSFQQLLQRVKVAMGGAFCHADVPFQAVAEAVAEHRGAAPIYQVLELKLADHHVQPDSTTWATVRMTHWCQLSAYTKRMRGAGCGLR